MIRANAGRELSGNVGSIHQFIDITTATGTYNNPLTGRVDNTRGCRGAMGHSFAAGTTDGPGGFNFTQGDTSGNPMWDAVTNFLSPPTADDIACHSPKPILLMPGGASRPYQWVPRILPTQIFTIGDAVLVSLPGEFTTMAGRRVRSLIQTNFGSQRQVILSGLTNIYSSYVVTPEEYLVQRYEGASTLYGPHTLPLLLDQFNRLMTALVTGQTVAAGPTPPDERSSQMTFLTPVINDDSGSFAFGHCLVQPNPTHRRGEQVFASFVSGSPRNNLNTGSSFFFVEQQQPSGLWNTIATDANWYFELPFFILSTSLLHLCCVVCAAAVVVDGKLTFPLLFTLSLFFPLLSTRTNTVLSFSYFFQTGKRDSFGVERARFWVAVKLIFFGIFPRMWQMVFTVSDTLAHREVPSQVSATTWDLATPSRLPNTARRVSQAARETFPFSFIQRKKNSRK